MELFLCFRFRICLCLMFHRVLNSLFLCTGPISYLDDVPFKINDKFRCPAKVGLPVGFCPPNCVSLLLDTEVSDMGPIYFIHNGWWDFFGAFATPLFRECAKRHKFGLAHFVASLIMGVAYFTWIEHVSAVLHLALDWKLNGVEWKLYNDKLFSVKFVWNSNVSDLLKL